MCINAVFLTALVHTSSGFPVVGNGKSSGMSDAGRSFKRGSLVARNK